MSLSFIKRNGNSCSTSILAGTYMVDALNSVTFFSSTSEIKLMGDALQITSTTDDDKTRDDTFIRCDNEESSEDLLAVDEDNSSSLSNPSYDGSAIIAQIQGTWEIIDVSEECQKKNTIEFVSSDEVVFTQHKKTFNRNDLLRYNVSVTYSLQSGFSAVITREFNTITFDNNSDCQFTKKSRLSYLVEDAKPYESKNLLN